MLESEEKANDILINWIAFGTDWTADSIKGTKLIPLKGSQPRSNRADLGKMRQNNSKLSSRQIARNIFLISRSHG